MKRIGIACIGAGKLGIELPHVEMLHVCRLPVIYHDEELLGRHSVEVMILTDRPAIEIAEMVLKRLPESDVRILDFNDIEFKRHIPISDMLLNDTFVMTISDFSMDDYKLDLIKKEFDYSLHIEKKNGFKYSSRKVKINLGNRKKKAFFQRRFIS